VGDLGRQTHLRLSLARRLTFRSGKKPTAADIFYRFNRLADPDAKSPFHWLGDIDSITADDLHRAVLPAELPLL
jgi:hypothetical protein